MTHFSVFSEFSIKTSALAYLKNMKKIILLTLLGLISSFEVFGNDNRFHPSFNFYASRGQIDGWSLSRTHGENNDVDTTTLPEDVIPWGGMYTFATTFNILNVVSSDTADTAAGTGCRTILVTGLDENYEVITEAFSLNGTTTVNGSTQFFRVNDAVCTSSGSGEVNAGDITISHGENNLAQIPADLGANHAVIKTVPANHWWLVDNLYCALQRKGSNTAVVEARIKPFATQTWQEAVSFGLDGAGSSHVNSSPPPNRSFVVPPKTDVKITIRFVGSNDTPVHCNLAGFLQEGLKGF